jgi:SPP1 gp7 family putative phage head morphogenesis protein
MCDAHVSDEALNLVHDARVSADWLAEYLTLPVRKDLDLSTARGFDRAVALLAAELRRSAGPANAAAVRAVIGTLDVDWSRTTPVQRSRLIAAATKRAGKALAPVAEEIRAPLGRAAESVVRATRSDARRRQRLGIRAEFNAVDRRVVRHVVDSHVNFVRDEDGRRLGDFSERARRVVADGLEAGLGRTDIARDLEQAAQAALVNRAPAYWEVVAAAFTGRARSWSQMSSYVEAGVQEYVIEAVLDERTTAICRLMHGKRFSVSDALSTFERVETLRDPEGIRLVQPWVREMRDAETGRRLLYAETRRGRVAIAEVLRSAEGRRDDRGEFRAIASDSRLAGIGVSMPPFHSSCRTTTLAV